MSLTDVDFRTILDDATKLIEGNIAWKEDEDRSPAEEFCAEARIRHDGTMMPPETQGELW